MSRSRKETLDKSLLKDLAKRYFIGRPVKIARGVSGQQITPTGAYRLGCKAGPSLGIEHLFHEMGHLAEREPEKLLERPDGGWGFTWGKYWQIANSSGWEPQTEQSVLREARVWSFQLSLMREHGLNPKPREMVESAVFIPAFCYFKYKRVSPDGPNGPKRYDETENEAIDLLAQIVEENTRIYTALKFEEDWNARLELLHNTPYSDP